MIRVCLLYLLLLSSWLLPAQKHVPLPHGMTFGKKLSTLKSMSANKLETFMGNKVRISTMITGKIIKVTKSKGGWFDMDAGGGKVIHAHFTDYIINLPVQLRGRTVSIEGVAAKQFIADDLQHFAGDTVKGARQHYQKTDPKHRIVFEVTGLMVL
jgi:hypothetical protein